MGKRVEDRNLKQLQKVQKIGQPGDTLLNTFNPMHDICIGESTIHLYMNVDSYTVYIPVANMFEDYFHVKPDTSRVTNELSYPDIMFIKLMDDWRDTSSNTLQLMMSVEGLRKYIKCGTYSSKKTDKQLLYNTIINTGLNTSKNDLASTSEEVTQVEEELTESSEIILEQLNDIEEANENNVIEQDVIECLKQLDEVSSQLMTLVENKDMVIQKQAQEIKELNETIEELKQKICISPVVMFNDDEDIDDSISLSAQGFIGIETLKHLAKEGHLPSNIRGIFNKFTAAVNKVTKVENYGVVKTEIFQEVGKLLNIDIYAELDKYKQDTKLLKSNMLDYMIAKCPYHLVVSMYIYATNNNYTTYLLASICKHFNIDSRNVNFALYFLRSLNNISTVKISYALNKIDVEYAKKHKTTETDKETDIN